MKYLYFDGYWVNYRYFDCVKDELRHDFRPLNPMSDNAMRMIDRVQSCNAVFIGVRRGDYLKSRMNRKIFGTLDTDYYHRAIRYVADRVQAPKFFVFSNDIQWAIDNMGFQQWDTVFRRSEDVVEDFEELQIMASCKHAILGNSTFHWWGAQMINNESKLVISPKPWYPLEPDNEIVPPEWVQLERISNNVDMR